MEDTSTVAAVEKLVGSVDRRSMINDSWTLKSCLMGCRSRIRFITMLFKRE